MQQTTSSSKKHYWNAHQSAHRPVTENFKPYKSTNCLCHVICVNLAMHNILHKIKFSKETKYPEIVLMLESSLDEPQKQLGWWKAIKLSIYRNILAYPLRSVTRTTKSSIRMKDQHSTHNHYFRKLFYKPIL